MENKYAGFWVRLLALIIDGLLLSLILMPILKAVFPSDVVSSSYMASGAAGFSTNLGGTAGTLYSILSMLYFVVMTVMFGGTLGKMAMKIKVVDENGANIGWGAGVLREVVGKFISAIVIGLGYLWVAFDAKKQGWHDKIAKTYVVYK